MSDVSAPAGFYDGNVGESPYFMSDDLFTVTWSTAFWPYVTLYPLSDQGGMTIGSSLRIPAKATSSTLTPRPVRLSLS